MTQPGPGAPHTASPRLALFDLDRTLLEVNSGSLWLRSEFRAGYVPPRVVIRGMWQLARYAMGDASLDTAMEQAAKVYEGVPEDQLVERIQAWFDEQLAHRFRPGGLTALAEHRAAGDTCVLATTTSQFLARAAAQKLGLDDAVSSVVEVRDGRITGRLTHSAFGAHKLTQCEAWAEENGYRLADATFYTDSFTDLPLLERVARPMIVHPDHRLARVARQRGWEVVQWSS